MSHRMSGTLVCCIPSCRKSKRKDHSLKMFSFPPADQAMGQIWREKCHIPLENYDKKLKICQNHFHESDIGVRLLKRGAVPTQMLGYEIEDNFDFDELPAFSGSFAPEVACRNCMAQTKCADTFRKKYTKLQKENKKLRKELTALKQKTKAESSAAIAAINRVKGISKNSKKFCKLLLKGRQKTYGQGYRNLVQNLYYVSRKSYLFMRNRLNLNLPHENSVDNWTPIKNLQPGLINSGLELFRAKINTLSQVERDHAIMVFDESSIRAELRYNRKLDLIDGVEVDGAERKDLIGKEVSVFMVKGMLSNWSLIFNYFVSKNGLTGDGVSEIILHNVKKLKEVGVTIRALTCDQGSANRKAYSNLGVSIQKPYFLFEGKKIHCTHDFPHLIKSLRNAWLKSDFETPDGIVSFQPIKEVWEKEKSLVTKLCPKLTRQHIEPTHFEKMKVKLATQVFSHTVHAAIKTVNSLSGFLTCSKQVALSTAVFIEKVNNVFDCMNSSTLYGDNKYRSALQTDSVSLMFIKEFLEYLDGVKVVQKPHENKKTLYFIAGMKLTLNAVIQLCDELFAEEEGHVKFLTTRKLNQDKLENTFSIVRQKGGYNRNPSVAELNSIFAKIMTSKLIRSSINTNCEFDDDQVTLETAIELATQELLHGKQDSDVKADFYSEKENFEDCCLTFQASNEMPIIEEASVRYVAGFVAHKILPKIGCHDCKEIIQKDSEVLSSPSELFIFYKNYNKDTNFGSLFAPSAAFYEACCTHVNVFKYIFANKPSILGIKELIIKKCKEETPDWFSGKCEEHKLQMLSYLILLLLQKHCLWATEKIRHTK